MSSNNPNNLPLYLDQLCVGYKNRKKENIVLKNINLELHPGELICILGQNGTGKSTLIRTIAGVQPALSGTIKYEGKSIRNFSAQELAKKISIVLTEKVNVGHFTVASLVALGRYPYTGWLGMLTDDDKKVISSSVEATGLQHYLARNVSELSDGECQKVMIARALTQQSPVMLLDEPTAYLDLPSKVEIMQLLRKLTKEQHKAILVSTHDLDLALQVADRIWLIHANGEIKSGVSEDLILNGAFEAAFNKNEITFDKTSGKFKMSHFTRKRVVIKGDAIGVYWTGRALERDGYDVSPENEHITDRIEVIMNNNNNKEWRYFSGNNLKGICFTIQGLLDLLKKN